MDKDSLKVAGLEHVSSRNKLELPYLPPSIPILNKQSNKFISPLRFLNSLRKDSNPTTLNSAQRRYDPLTPIMKRDYEDLDGLDYRINPVNIWRHEKPINRLSTQKDRQKSMAQEYVFHSEIEEEESAIHTGSPNSVTSKQMKSKTFYNSQKRAIYQRKLVGLPYQQEISRYRKMYSNSNKGKYVQDGKKQLITGSADFHTPIPDSMFQFESRKKGQDARKDTKQMSRIPDLRPVAMSKKDLLADTKRTDSRAQSTASLHDKGQDNELANSQSQKHNKEGSEVSAVVVIDKKKTKKMKKRSKKAKITNVSVADVMKQIETENEQRKCITQEGFARTSGRVFKNLNKTPSPTKPAPPRPSNPGSSLGKARPSSHTTRINSTAPSGSELVDRPNEFAVRKKPPPPPAVAERTDIKSREENIDALLKNRTSLDFEKLMEEYNKRKGLDENTKVFILNSQDDHIRRILKQKGWSENKHLTSSAFHFKWSYTDSEADYKSLKPGQMFNHFQNNRELTTKSGLSKNLRSVDRYGVDIDTFFPRCYDLGIQAQVEEFKVDYKKQEIYNTVKRHAEYFMKTKEEELCILNTKCLMHAVEYTRHMIDTLNDNCERQEKYSFMQGYDPVFSIAPDDMKHLRVYCNYTLPLGSISREEMLKSSYSYEMEYIWVKPSPEMISKTVNIHNLLLKTFPQAYMEGSSNVWIVKPGQNARGSGIYCIRDMDTIINLASKMNARVIQKYIERPLLLTTSKGNCKFDIRQWVLVTSFEPLTVYMYNSCYLRICQRPYDLNNISDTYSHLANFSLQKSVAKSAEDTVWSLERFLSYLSEQHS